MMINVTRITATQLNLITISSVIPLNKGLSIH